MAGFILLLLNTAADSNEECPMNKCLAMLALSGMIAACATQPAATVEAAEPAAKTQAETRVCEEFEKESTGTRLGTERVCKTVPAKEKAPQTS